MRLNAISPHWTAEEWSAFGTVLIGLGAVAAGAWALFNYRKNRRVEAAVWLRDVFHDFYLGNRFSEIKGAMEYGYAETLAPLLERRVANPDIRVSPGEIALLDQLDMLLNYFEFVLYLESEGHVKQRDQQAVFDYWLELMLKKERAAIRRYVANFKFDRVAQALECKAANYFFFYGCRGPEGTIREKPALRPYLVYDGTATLEGELIHGTTGEMNGEVTGEIYKVNGEDKEFNHEAFRAVDRSEQFDASDYAGSLFVRRAVCLKAPALDAWVYVRNRDTSPVAGNGRRASPEGSAWTLIRARAWRAWSRIR